MAAPQRQEHSALSVFAALAAVAAFLVATLGVVVAVVNDSGGSGGGGSSAGAPVPVSLTEFAITPDTINAPSGDVTLAVTNDGGQIHNLSVTELGETTPDLNGGGAATLELSGVADGTYEVICTIPGHAEAGMVGTLVVGGSADLAAAGGEEEHDYKLAEDTQAQNIADYLEAAATEGTGVPTEGRGNEVMEPRIAADGAWEFDISAELAEWEVEPGNVVTAWTYNGTVPGPWIKVPTNTLVRVNLTNNLPEAGTDIHFHGITTTFASDGVAPLTQPLVMPGSDYVYEFRTNDQFEMGMFHAHMHGQEALPGGMYGIFQVGETPLPRGQTINGVTIPEDLAIDQELGMVLNDAGAIGLSLNGKGFPATDPIITQVGESVVVHYHNEGLQIHPMHLHQVRQLVIAKDGFPLEQPYWADTVNVAPGERYTVLMLPDEGDLNNNVDGTLKTDEALGGAGIWAYHCHILNHAESDIGLFGMVTVMVVLPAEAA